MNRTANPTGRRISRLPLFVAAHVAAVLALYGTALAVGGGFVSPMPPATRTPAAQVPAADPRAAQALATPRSQPLPADETHAPADGADTAPADLAPPWHIDAQGEVRFIGR